MGSRRFKADTRQILNLVTHSLYSDREIFLRELISNASDALDKIRFVGLQRDDLRTIEGDPAIRLSFDVEAGTITIEDDGIGLTEDEASEHLGTIARSGTSAFAEALKEKGENPDALIGQFGVGFYSAFMVADEVIVESLSALPDAEAICWKSDGGDRFSIGKGERTTRGTAVTLKLRENATEFADADKLREIVRKHSDFVAYPVMLDDAQVNRARAIWAASPGDVTEEEYTELYKHVSMDWNEPLTKIHIRAEGTLQFNAILFIPKNRPFQLDRLDFKIGVQLFQKGVKVLDHADAIVPRFLRFVSGVVDAPDLDLNVSREILQKTPLVAAIRKQITKKLLKHLAAEAKKEGDDLTYDLFWGEFGHILKEGVAEDAGNSKDLLTGLLRYPTTESEGAQVSLAEIKEGMEEGQEDLWYYTSVDKDRIGSAPVLEGFAKREWEVILMTDPVDEWVAMSLSEFDGVNLKSVLTEELPEDEENEDADTKKAKDEARPLITWMSELLSADVAEVRMSSRLTDSPSVLVDKAGGMGSNMERILKAANQEVGPGAQRVLEINPEHALVQTLAKLNNEGATGLEPFARLLLDHAAIAEGKLDDPKAFAGRLQTLMTKAAQSMGGA
jgi:molecular chaperone HtpG